MYEPYNYNIYNPYSPYYNYNQQAQQVPRQTTQQPYRPQNSIGLQGKVVDSLDVVKATDIPYDGSISYFPLTDGTAIITKQLQQDGTSKVIIYKPISEDEGNAKSQYITENELNELKDQLKVIDSKFITGDDLKDQLKNVNSKDIKDIKEDIKTLKRRLEDVVDDIRYKKEK